MGSHSWHSLCYDGNKFVALGYGGYISTSIDGSTWITASYKSELGSHNWCSICYDGNKFVALGYNGYISTSTDGSTWTTATQNANLGSNYWLSLIYDGIKFVALGSSGYISTSTDGTTWTVATQNANLGSNSWYSLCYDGTKFVALGSNGYISLLREGTSVSNIAGNSLGIKFTDLSKEYTLLDGTTGLLSSDRIPDNFVLNTGDTMTGDLGINKADPHFWTKSSSYDSSSTTAPSSPVYACSYRALDKNGVFSGEFFVEQDTVNNMCSGISAQRIVSGTPYTSAIGTYVNSAGVDKLLHTSGVRQDLVNLSLPKTGATQITIGNSGDDYTATSSGYVWVIFTNAGNGNPAFGQLKNNTTGMTIQNQIYSNYGTITLLLPAIKGETFKIAYDNISSTSSAWFFPC